MKDVKRSAKESGIVKPWASALFSDEEKNLMHRPCKSAAGPFCQHISKLRSESIMAVQCGLLPYLPSHILEEFDIHIVERKTLLIDLHDEEACRKASTGMHVLSDVVLRISRVVSTSLSPLP